MAVLTTAQKMFFEINGFVMLPRLLDASEVERLRATLYRMRDDNRRREKGVFLVDKGRSYYARMGNLLEYDRVFVDFAAHPRLVPLAEDLVGGAVRLEETEAIINRRDPNADLEQLRRDHPNAYNLHRAMDPSWGAFVEQGRMHSLFVKAIAYLTDVGPGDGGTAVVPGSHRMLWPRAQLLEATRLDPTLIHVVEAQAGTVMMFAETLLHSTTAIRGDRDRVIVTAGYAAPMLRMEVGNYVRPEFAAELPESLRPLIAGSQRWRWTRHYE